MDIGAISHTGLIRDINQDSYFVSEDKMNLFIVADGMGGHKAGEVASSIAIDSVKKYIEEHISKKNGEYDEAVSRIIEEAIVDANTKIFNKSMEEEKYQGMGTTLTMAFIQSKLFIGHIGDSRAYLIRNNEIKQITQDHSLVAELLRNGTITEKEAKTHPQKNIITRALGTEENIQIDIYTIELLAEDIIVLCSDGLSNLVEQMEIKECLTNSNSMQSGCEHLVDLANERGGYDNITIIGIKNNQ
ncbi:MAG: Stp1/IreP family PP2C-type Ser/Thr phosphatase [Anaerosolibacter sp.]|jgi:protein phosphatase|uniref:Stp1/IreP family PP2C-type Ser/Thr phosphatase n=1 Tax=Anaerosolibacter sp. TaxID=1872527 RepID=UPI002616F635|nr:Stp1/IreP family PP2C-type Ser/Thr phosphatase [Anaerosolibacter sp.]MDF2546838.1 Stp1/IreP family PP2C-type Ser/Thr phosphatase [Anaerosolibacter sp.]